MSCNNYTIAARVVSSMKSSRVNADGEVVSTMLVHCSYQLAVLQRELCAVISDEFEGAAVIKNISIVRSMMIRVLDFYDNYESRKSALKLFMNDGNWRVGDALCGSDHAYVLNRIEPVSKYEIVSSRLCGCHGDGDDSDGRLVKSASCYNDKEMSSMSGTVSSVMETAYV